MHLPQGFKPVTLEQMLQHFKVGAENALGHMLWEHMKLPESEVVPKIVSLEQRGLVQFAITDSGEPSLFIAPKTANGVNLYASDEEHAFADRMVSFWDTTGKFDPQQGEILSATGGKYIVRTPEGPLSLAESVATKLWKLGLITENEQGQLIGPSKRQVQMWVDEHGICDFCSDPNPKHVVMVPDFELLPGTPDQSTGGWAACNTCHQLVLENRRTDLARRAIEAAQFGRFTAAAIQGLHKRFWNAYDMKIEAAGTGLALMDFIEDRIEPEMEFENPKLQDRARRVEAIRKLTGLTQAEMQALERGDVLHSQTAQKLTEWKRKYGVDTPANVKRIAAMLDAAVDSKLPPSTMPHWQEAVERKIEAINALKVVERLPKNHVKWSDIRWMDLTDDLAALRAAEVYSFSAETMHAIMTGAQSIPHESSLKSVELPSVRSGWFWFAEPFPVATSPLASDTTAALLWGWDTNHKAPTLRFSAYVIDDKQDGFGDIHILNHVAKPPCGRVLPSTKWLWPIDLSFHEMMGLNTQLYRNAYGPDGPFANQPNLTGEEPTRKVIAELSLFFLMACLWFRQTVPGTKKKIEPKLTQEAGHIERHARKRYQKELKLSDAPVVRVIALRKSVASLVEHEGADEAKRHLKVRFVVAVMPGCNRADPA
jgi:hypothetical protein